MQRKFGGKEARRGGDMVVFRSWDWRKHTDGLSMRISVVSEWREGTVLVELEGRQKQRFNKSKNISRVLRSNGIHRSWAGGTAASEQTSWWT